MTAFEPPTIKSALLRLSPKQRQYAALALIMAIGVGALWAVMAVPGNNTKSAGSQSTNIAGEAAAPTNIDLMAPGQQINPVDQWVGTAGRKLAQYEHDRDEQSRINHEHKDFEDKTMQRFGELEQRLTAAATAAKSSSATPELSTPIPTSYPPASALPANPPTPNGRSNAARAMPSGTPEDHGDAPMPGLVHVSMRDPAKSSQPHPASALSVHAETRDTIDTYLPVSFTRGILLGGLDAPTGGQSQSNPHPVLIRLADNSVLPNRFRAEYQECFVVAAGYGDISSERAYLRTETLSCVRDDGSTLDVKIQGSIYGEDGKVGMRGRLVSKQGQILANALLAGVVSGIGQGLSNAATTTSTSALGTIASVSGSDAYRAGLGTGVGHALDRLAQYYIKLAEQTFPVIEIDAGREIDVVITKGVRINAPIKAKNGTFSHLASLPQSPEDRYRMEAGDEDY